MVTSPLTAPPAAISRKSRRMILPERVLGRESVNRRSSGLAMGPISLTTCCRSSSLRFSEGLYAPSRVTKATMAWPFNSSGRPTTAASATLSCDTRALSTSMVPRRWPPTLMTSSTRPMIQ